jgi:hypothetical protein
MALVASCLVAALTAPIHAGEVEKTMYLTFSGPVRLPGVTLAAGTYEFEIANPLTSGDIVRVRSRDGRHSYFQGFTTPVSKPPQMKADASISLGESVKGSPAPIVAWYPEGERTGRRFEY